MRKLYIICFVTLTTLFVTCYCIGYYAVTKKNRVEQPANDYYEMRAAAAADESVIRRDTELIIEEYNINNHISAQTTVIPSIDILGLDREAYTDYLRRYMEKPDKEDVDRGLSSINLVEFSADRIVVRAMMHLPTVQRRILFFMRLMDGL